MRARVVGSRAATLRSSLLMVLLLIGYAGSGYAQDAEPADSAASTTEEPDRKDPWGAKHSVGLAVGEVAMINAVVWSFNEFIRGGNFTQVNPRTWWSNISGGFFFDDNQFTTNLFAHPYHGSLYYSAARTNGLSYWESAPFSIMGSFFWECCGEAHPPAWNDWVATGIGGIAIGEVLYRTTSTILDNEATGMDRFGREAATFLLSPLRGFNRLVSGRAGRVYANPESAYDRVPPHLANILRVGWRALESDRSTSLGSSSESYNTAFVEFDMRHGDSFQDTRRKPFDQFHFGVTVNFHDARALGRLQIVGNLLSKDLKQSENVHHVFTLTQNFDYVNNRIVEFGGQSFGAGIASLWRLSDNSALVSNVNAHGYLLNAVNSEYAFGASIPDRERLREYDMGAGAGAWLRLGFVHNRHEYGSIGYRAAWVHTLNGSNTNGGDSNHTVQWGNVEASIPVVGRFGIGADATLWLRDSYFDEPNFLDVSQDAARYRIFGVLRTY